MAHTSRRRFLELAAALPAAAAAPAKRPPNIIVLFADDMGYGDLACYGHPTLRTPNIDRMAEEGTRFTSFYAAAPVCTPSRVGLLTGRYPVRAGQPNNLGPDSKGGLPLSEVLIPQVLKTRGYKTKAIGKWHLGHQPKEHLPTSRGFDSYLGLLYSNDMIPPWVKTNRPLQLYRDTEPIETITDQSNLTEIYTAEALRFIRSARGGPFFLYLPYAMPHLPVSAPQRMRGRSRAGLYGDVIETLDWSAGEILRTVKEQGLDSNTMVIFATDNGPWHNLPRRMLQKGVEPWHTGTKNLLRGAKGTDLRRRPARPRHRPLARRGAPAPGRHGHGLDPRYPPHPRQGRRRRIAEGPRLRRLRPDARPPRPGPLAPQHLPLLPRTHARSDTRRQLEIPLRARGRGSQARSSSTWIGTRRSSTTSTSRTARPATAWRGNCARWRRS